MAGTGYSGGEVQQVLRPKPARGARRRLIAAVPSCQWFRLACGIGFLDLEC